MIIMRQISQDLSDDEIKLIGECLRATAEGSFFPDWEFQTLLGVDRATVSRVSENWPHVTIDLDEFACAVIGSLNNLVNYPHGKREELRKYLTFEVDDIPRALDRLVELGL